MTLPNKVYDIMKWLIILFIPALATFYGVVASIWQLPFADEFSKTLIAIDTFLGTILGVSSINYEQQKKEELRQARVLNAQEDENEN